MACYTNCNGWLLQMNKIELLCIKKGLKMTDQRKVIARVISESLDHPFAEQVYARAILIDSNISLSTVYRTINIFEGYGILEKLDFLDGKARYEAKITEDNHHHHLIDIESGTIIEFQDKELELLKEKIAAKLGYELIDHRLELFGRKKKI